MMLINAVVVSVSLCKATCQMFTAVSKKGVSLIVPVKMSYLFVKRIEEGNNIYYNVFVDFRYYLNIKLHSILQAFYSWLMTKSLHRK